MTSSPDAGGAVATVRRAAAALGRLLGVGDDDPGRAATRATPAATSADGSDTPDGCGAAAPATPEDPARAGGALPDDLPRDGLFAQPLTVTASVLRDDEPVDDGTRVTFKVLVTDAEGRRCNDVHVEARVTGPVRSAVGETTTNMLGAARFRTSGPAGTYRLDVTEVAGGALAWRDDDRATRVSVTID